ncbi:PREDICTED: putative SWI/SNF-related matrix-associated actin-dependent regulator of chromatin subfamily A member 3-like 3 [Ipomoea nil]|uniref:putative SWI/SNF-related matrix-associated actin-dependent regulator of chromatin subfamily A member 3-like 3 n=1 Tax=Ipomoea nil TaxID=35883 RepID=UPI0009012DB7|nr:PREDICTED: putative SWI/SNF-related matrix-associated actin-dependent regulator of chromatin subfamily A member 3-like 3 [Ipomoea nil]
MYRNMPGGPVLIPGFCLWKALQPVLPIFLQGLTSGSAELRKQSALGLADLSIFHEVDWNRIVVDEADTIKSWRTMSARAAFTLSAHCRWCLTGTPLQNNLPDLYSLLCFLHVEPWCNWAWWNKLIQRPYENGDQRALKLIKAILRPLMLRRTKETKDKEGR